MNSSPTIAAGTPTSAGSKKVTVRIGGAPGTFSANCSATMPAIIRLVEVPISVAAPPRMDAKLSGM